MGSRPTSGDSESFWVRVFFEVFEKSLAGSIRGFGLVFKEVLVCWFGFWYRPKRSFFGMVDSNLL